MLHATGHEGDAGFRWEALGAALREDVPSELDVARLRRRVREATGRHEVRRPVLRAAAVAATFSLVALGLSFLAGNPGGNGEPVRLYAERDGRVVIEFADGKVHRVARSTDPRFESEVAVKTAKGRKLVDDAEHPAPGQVVFYRID